MRPTHVPLSWALPLSCHHSLMPSPNPRILDRSTSPSSKLYLLKMPPSPQIKSYSYYLVEQFSSSKLPLSFQKRPCFGISVFLNKTAASSLPCNAKIAAFFFFKYLLFSLVAQRLERLPAMWETWVWSLGWHTPVFLPGESHGQRSLWTLSTGSQGVGHDWVTSLHFTFLFSAEI